MEFDKKLVYLSIPEQRETGYPSPIDIETADLHGMRVAADAERDRTEALAMLDPEEMTSDERATLPKQLAQAQARSQLMRSICSEAAMNNLVR